MSTDNYASEEETRALLRKDTRTPAEKRLDRMLEDRGASEQGAEAYPILRQIALELLAEQPAHGCDHCNHALYAGTKCKHCGRVTEQQCRTDGRCQYAIDSGAEGLGHCPPGKCCMPAQGDRP